jgi:hypothetical protein
MSRLARPPGRLKLGMTTPLEAAGGVPTGRVYSYLTVLKSGSTGETMFAMLGSTTMLPWVVCPTHAGSVAEKVMVPLKP